jgi:chitin disaccharide deacetylase
VILRRLVITADDFGLAPGVDAGIIEAAAGGSVTAVSVIMNLRQPPDISAAVARLREAAPNVGVGLHFNCVVGRPLTVSPSLTNESGNFFSLRTVVARALAGRIDHVDVSRECAAQVELLRELSGTVTHIDSHRHVHTLPPIWRSVVEVARHYRIPHVRMPIEPWRTHALDLRASAKKALVRGALYLATRRTTLPPSGERSHFVGMSLTGDTHFASRLLRLLDDLPAGTTEIMVHPGYADSAVRDFDGYISGRDVERAALTSSVIRERLSRGDITLTNFGR